MESGEIKSRSPFSTETDIFYCLEAPGNPYQFLHWQTSYLNTTGDGVYTEKPHSTGCKVMKPHRMVNQSGKD